MGLAKTEKELREETRARRAKQELKNTPLPLKRHNSLHKRSQKKLFSDSASSGLNNKSITSLMTRRVMTSLAHSRSMTDLRHDPGTSSQYSRSCADLSDMTSLRRSKSYSKITDQHSSWDKRLDSYRSTMSDMFTNVKTYSSKSIAALSSDNLLKAIRQGNSVGEEKEERWLRDPCWRARRVGEQYQPVQYNWREKLGMQNRLSSHSLSKSTPNIAAAEYSRSRIRTVSESPHLSPTYLPYSAGRSLGSHSKSCSNINTISDSSSSTSYLNTSTSYLNTSSSYLNTNSNYLNTSSDSTGYSMKKALRQLKVATSWLSSSASKQQEYSSYSSPTTATAARWSTTASHNRFSNIRARFA